MKLYLLCALDDENYADAEYDFFTTYEEAKKEAIAACSKQFDGDCDITVEDNGFRIVSESEKSFFITEIKEINGLAGESLLVWHHGYEGVGFDILFQGCRDEVENQRQIEMNKAVDLYVLSPDSDICGNVADVGNEWEVWDILDIPDMAK